MLLITNFAFSQNIKVKNFAVHIGNDIVGYASRILNHEWKAT